MNLEKNLVKGKTGNWEVVIGLEVHAQITSQAKLFSGSSTNFGAEPNTQVSFLDAGMPGMLPVLNEHCVNQAIKTGLGVNGSINKISAFDRKNYFYADLPTGYQISQFHYPIVTGGYLNLELEEEEVKRVHITRIHLEQDAGKSTHDLNPKLSYIDLNRAGIALMEIVSEPEMRSATEAMAYVKKLRSIMRYLGTCDGNMEQGSLRVDVNVSLRRPGEPLGKRAEIKNVNSIKFLGQAVTFEIYRQMERLEEGEEILQETRLFDPVKGETRSMRSKENAHDYRYFPDPDLLPLVLTEERISNIRSQMPELPDEKKARFKQDYGLSDYDASVLVAEKDRASYYETALNHQAAFNHKTALSHETAFNTAKSPDKNRAKLIANWLIGEVFGILNRESLGLHQLPFSAENLAELVDLIIEETISGKIAKDVFGEMWKTGKSPKQLVEEQGLQQISDVSLLEKAIEEILAAHPDKVADYKAGKIQLFGFFIGLTMKALQGKANPEAVNRILKEKL